MVRVSSTVDAPAPNTCRTRFASCSSYAIGFLLTVRDLLAVMARVELHEAHVVFHEHRAEDGRSHPFAVKAVWRLASSNF
jgi:hypothetical protein